MNFEPAYRPPNSHSLKCSLARTCTHTHTHKHSLSFSRIHTHTHTNSLALKHTHTHTYTQSALILSLPMKNMTFRPAKISKSASSSHPWTNFFHRDYWPQGRTALQRWWCLSLSGTWLGSRTPPTCRWETLSNSDTGQHPQVRKPDFKEPNQCHTSTNQQTENWKPDIKDTHQWHTETQQTGNKLWSFYCTAAHG